MTQKTERSSKLWNGSTWSPKVGATVTETKLETRCKILLAG